MPSESPENRKYAIWVASMASFLTPFLASSLNVALPGIGKEFSFNAVELTWVATAYLLSATLFLVPFGRLADIKGRKRIFRYGIWIEVTACLLATIIPSGKFFIMLRAFQGLGGAMIFSTGIAIMTTVYLEEERGRMLGINVAAVYSGLSLGPVIGGLLTQHFGWRSIFFVNILIGVTVIYLVTFKLKGDWAEAKGEPYDWIGNILYGIMFIATLYGFSIYPTQRGYYYMLGGLLAFLLFLRWERKIDYPIMDLRLFKITSFAFSNIAALINYSATYAVTFLVSLYLQYNKGFNPQNAGLVLLAQPVMMALFSPVAGRLSDRIEPRIVASIGMGLTAVGLGLFCFLKTDTSLINIVIGLLIFGLGFAFFSSPNINAIMSSVEKRFYGIASGIQSTMRLSGQLVSMGIATLCFSHFLGTHSIQPPYYGLLLQGIKTAFLVFTLSCILGIFASLARGTIHSIPGV